MTDEIKLVIGWRNARRGKTLSDNLPQLPQLGLEKSGQRKPNKDAMPQLPQPAPTVFNVYRMEKRRRGVWCAGREMYSRVRFGWLLFSGWRIGARRADIRTSTKGGVHVSMLDEVERQLCRCGIQFTWHRMQLLLWVVAPLECFNCVGLWRHPSTQPELWPCQPLKILRYSLAPYEAGAVTAKKL